MNLLLEQYDLAARIMLSPLLNSIWQATFILALAAGLLRAIRRLSAATRYAVWLMSLVAIGALPFLPAGSARFSFAPAVTPPNEVFEQASASPVTISAASASASEPHPSRSSTEQDARQASAIPAVLPAPLTVETPSPVFETRPLPPTPESFFHRTSQKLLSGRTPVVAFTIWIIGCAMMLIRIAGSYIYLVHLRCKLIALPEADCGRLNSLAAALGVRRKIRICTSPRVSAPLTIGFWRPLIVLPQGLVCDLSEAEFLSVVVHELAHIKRFDYVGNLLQRVIQAMLFFHPAIWIIGKHLVIERELACDDWAVKLTGEPRSYARCLTRLVELLSHHRPIAAATGMFFGRYVVSRRIEMILNAERNSSTRISKPAIISALAVVVGSLLLCSALSPVIAVPLSQVAKKKQEKTKKNEPPRVQPPAETPALPATVPLPPSVEWESQPATTPAAANELLRELQEAQETPPQPPRASTPLQLSTAGELPPGAGYAAAALQAELLAQTAASSKSATPALPESELLSVLTDIVKKDSDPAVRNEALQGIIRFRTDAGIESLITLYDSLADRETKSRVITSLLRRNGDNTKAAAKLVAIAKTEKDEDLHARAMSQLASLKGDESATSLISVFDSLSDPKVKQLVVRYLASTKNRNAIDKLIAIAKSDPDPTVRQTAIRSLYSIDNRLYMDLLDRAVVRDLSFAPAPAMGTGGGVGIGTGGGVGVGGLPSGLGERAPQQTPRPATPPARRPR